MHSKRCCLPVVTQSRIEMSNSLQCYVYKSLQKEETFLFVLHEDDFSTVPAPLLGALGQLEKIISLELTPYKKLARGHARYIMDDLIDKGFHLQLPTTDPDV